MNFEKQCTAHDQRVVAVHEVTMDGRGKPQHLERTTVEVIQGYRCWIHMYVRVSYRKRCDDRGRKKRYIYYRQW